MPEEPRCPECGFSIYSRVHLEGLNGVHEGIGRKVERLEGGVTVTSSANGPIIVLPPVIVGEGASSVPPPTPKPDLGTMSFAELRDMAKSLGLTVRVGTSKARLIEMLS